MASELPNSANERSSAKVIQFVKLNRENSWRIAPSLLVSFQFAWAGIVYAFQTQRNFRIHVIVGSLALTLGIWLHLSPAEIAVLSLTVAAVLTMELLNTAIESVVDLTVKQSYHELAKIAKDCAAGAVLISAIGSVGVASSLILPKLWLKVGVWLHAALH